MSATKAVKALVAALHAQADANRDPWFTLADVDALMRRANIESAKPLIELVDILRDQSYLMYQKRDDGHFAYKLTSCKYAANTGTQASLGPAHGSQRFQPTTTQARSQRSRFS